MARHIMMIVTEWSSQWGSLHHTCSSFVVSAKYLLQNWNWHGDSCHETQAVSIRYWTQTFDGVAITHPHTGPLLTNESLQVLPLVAKKKIKTSALWSVLQTEWPSIKSSWLWHSIIHLHHDTTCRTLFFTKVWSTFMPMACVSNFYHKLRVFISSSLQPNINEIVPKKSISCMVCIIYSEQK